MWWCQFIDLLKFETRPSPLLNFGTANCKPFHPMATPCRVCRVNALQFKDFNIVPFQTPAVTIYHVVLRQMPFPFLPKLIELSSTFDLLNEQPG